MSKRTLLPYGDDEPLHPIANDGGKAYNAELRYPIHEEELLPVPVAADTWKDSLYSKQIENDNPYSTFGYIVTRTPYSASRAAHTIAFASYRRTSLLSRYRLTTVTYHGEPINDSSPGN